MRIVRGSVMAVLGSESVGEFIHIECAQSTAPALFNARDSRCIVFSRRGIGTNDGTRECGHAADIEKILDGERNAGQRPGSSPSRDLAVYDFGGFASARSASTAVKQFSSRSILRYYRSMAPRVTSSSS